MFVMRCSRGSEVKGQTRNQIASGRAGRNPSDSEVILGIVLQRIGVKVIPQKKICNISGIKLMLEKIAFQLITSRLSLNLNKTGILVPHNVNSFC